MESKDYYKAIIKEHLKEHHRRFLRELENINELEEILDYRATRFLEQMSRSSNPQDEKEIYYQEMLTF
jgi:hypothetical protein